MRRQFFAGQWPSPWSPALRELHRHVAGHFQRDIAFFFDSQIDVWGRALLERDRGSIRPVILIQPQRLAADRADARTVLAHEMLHLELFAQGYVFDRQVWQKPAYHPLLSSLCNKLVGVFVHRCLHPMLLAAGFEAGELLNLRIRWRKAQRVLDELLHATFRLPLADFDPALPAALAVMPAASLAHLDVALLLADLCQRADHALYGDIREFALTLRPPFCIQWDRATRSVRAQAARTFGVPNLWQQIEGLLQLLTSSFGLAAKPDPFAMAAVMNQQLTEWGFAADTTIRAWPQPEPSEGSKPAIV